MRDETRRARFEALVLPHLDAAYGLARWLTRDTAQAEEAVQEAFLRAFRYFGAFHGDDARPWLLGVVRNACYGVLRSERQELAVRFEADAVGDDGPAPGAVVPFPLDPEASAIARAERELVRRCLRELPPEYREAVVLREMHDCSYREMAQIMDVPIGTAMSRLARGRRLLRGALAAQLGRRGTGT
ncbi:MAG: sigma-70 family RNA polymerase sigma factor [Pseudomonadota bacterium]